MMGVKREREGKWRAVSVPLRGNVRNNYSEFFERYHLPGFPSPCGEGKCK